MIKTIMIRPILIAATMLVLGGRASWADQFQLRAPNGDILQYAVVIIKDRNHRAVARRYTDRLGRFQFTESGSYIIEVNNYSGFINIRGDRYLKRVTMRQGAR